MRATWRPLPAWPYPEGHRLKGDRLRAPWDQVLVRLEDEIARLKGTDVVIGVVVDESQVGFSGNLKAGGRTAFRHRGVEISFEVPKRGRLVFHTDAYDDVTANLRAIGLGLEALRAVDRHGITSAAEQYAGFQQLTAGGPDPERGRRLVERYGSLRAAVKAAHEDTRDPSLTDLDWLDLQAYREATEGKLAAGAR